MGKHRTWLGIVGLVAGLLLTLPGGLANAATSIPNVNCVSDPNIFNTAYNAATGGVLPDNSNDANWQVAGPYNPSMETSTVSLPAAPTWGPAVVGNHAPGSWATSPYNNANWIQQPQGASSGTGDWYYMYQFNLDPSVDPSTFSLQMNFLADNSADEVWVNGTPQSTLTTGIPQLPRPWTLNGGSSDPYFYVGFSYANRAQTLLNHDWQTGLNTIIVQIKSGPPEEGFDAQITPSAVCPVNLHISKTESPNPYGPGSTVNYSITVTNSGPGVARGLTISDPLAGVVLSRAGWTCTATSGSSCTPSGTGNIDDAPSGSYPGPTIYPGGSLTYSVSGPLPFAAPASITNTATVTPPAGTIDPGCSPSCSASASAVFAAPKVSIQKVADAANGDQTPVTVGEKISYSYVVTNTGNVPLTQVSVSDPNVGAVSCPTPAAPGLEPSDSETCTANTPHTVTQADVDAGGVSDTATASCKDAFSQTCPASNQSSTHIPSAPKPTVAVTKAATVTPSSDQSGYQVGDSIQYTYKVTNTGNVDEATVSVNDPTAGAVSCPLPAPPGLAPGASETCTANSTHTVTQADVDAGQLSDTATAGCTDNLKNACPTSAPSTAVLPAVPANPSASIQKIANAANGDQTPITVGEQISYSYLVTNTGNVDLPTVSVDDPTAGAVSCPTPPAPGLAPGQSELCTANAPYTVTQSDVDNGNVTDTATLSCADTAGNLCAPVPPSTIVVPSSPSPAVNVDKHATVTPSADADGVRVGDKIAYSYTVTNIGNVDLTSVSVSDPTLGPVSCPTPPAPGLAPGAQETCTGRTVTVTQSDVDAGSVSDSATAGCIDTLGASCGPSNKSTVILPAVSAEPLTSVKKTAEVSPSRDQHKAKLGDKIRYTYLVTNVGNVDLTSVSVSDPTIGPVSCPTPAAPGLAPGASETCKSEGFHRVTAADLKAGEVADVAQSMGTDPRGQLSAVSAPSRAVVKVAERAPKLKKTASVKRASAGQNVVFTLRVTNPGPLTITKVTVCDSLPRALLYVRSSPRAHLSRGRYCWTTRRLSPHHWRTFRITANVAPSGGGEVTNHATASAHGTPTAHASAKVHVNGVQPIACPSAVADSRRDPTAHITC